MAFRGLGACPRECGGGRGRQGRTCRLCSAGITPGPRGGSCGLPLSVTLGLAALQTSFAGAVPFASGEGAQPRFPCLAQTRPARRIAVVAGNAFEQSQFDRPVQVVRGQRRDDGVRGRALR